MEVRILSPALTRDLQHAAVSPFFVGWVFSTDEFLSVSSTESGHYAKTGPNQDRTSSRDILDWQLLRGQGVLGDTESGASFVVVLPLAGHTVPNSTRGIVHVSAVPGNHVTVEMHDGLPCSLSTVHTNVIAVR